MKKTLIIVAYATFIFTSCKKDYNCSCDTIATIELTGETVTDNVTTVINETSSKAITACDAMDRAEVDYGPYTLETVCSIK